MFRRSGSWARRWSAVGLSVVMAAAAAVAAPVTAGAVLGQDDYPVDLKSAPRDAVIDPWGFYNRNCTSFAAWRMNDLLGRHSAPWAFTNTMRGGRWGNANTWDDNARALGYAVNTSPAVGAIAQTDAGTYGHVAVVVAVNGGSVVVEEYNGGNTGAYRTRTAAVSDFRYIHIPGAVRPGGGTSLPNGSYVVASDTGRVYVMAGGSPMYVSAWGAVGGPHPISGTFTQAQIDALPRYPADGTAIRNFGTGGIYVVAGGFGFAVASLNNIPNASWVNIDGAAMAQLRAQPHDGTVIRNYSTGGIYVVSGGAALGVSSLANIPYTSWTNVDGWAITNQMRRYPADGSAIVDHSDGTVYIIAGGAPMTVASFANIPPVVSLAHVDHWVLANQLRRYPANGTVIRDYRGGGIHVVAGGAALGIASLTDVPYTTWVNVDNWGITHDLRAYPTDGTYLHDHTTGKVYLVQNGTTTYLPNWGAAGPQPVVDIDPWTLTNQLHATG